MKKILDLAKNHESNSAKRAKDFRTKLEAELDRAEARLSRFSSESAKKIKTVITEQEIKETKRKHYTKVFLVGALILSVSANLAMITEFWRLAGSSQAMITIHENHLRTQVDSTAVIITLQGEHPTRVANGNTQIRIEK